MLLDVGTIAGVIDGGGGAGSDALIGPNLENEWDIDGPSAGSVNGISFARFESLIGGNRDDAFKLVGSSGSIGAIHGGSDDGVDDDDNPIVAEDSLDYSAHVGAVEVDLASSDATGVSAFASIEFVIGSAAIDTLHGPDDPHVAWIITGADERSRTPLEDFEPDRRFRTSSDSFN